jgi:hypothetical protein
MGMDRSSNEITYIYPYNMMLIEEYTTDSLSESYLCYIVHNAQIVLIATSILAIIYLTAILNGSAIPETDVQTEHRT